MRYNLKHSFMSSVLSQPTRNECLKEREVAGEDKHEGDARPRLLWREASCSDKGRETVWTSVESSAVSCCTEDEGDTGVEDSKHKTYACSLSISKKATDEASDSVCASNCMSSTQARSR